MDHIGIAVRHLDSALQFFTERLGLPPACIEERPEHGLRIARMVLGGVELELIEAQDWQRTTQRHLPHRGPGVYHVGLRVDDVDAAVEQLARDGVQMIDRVPREGERMRVSFVHPDAVEGALVELVERRDP